MPRRIVVDENGFVVSVESLPGITDPTPSKQKPALAIRAREATSEGSATNVGRDERTSSSDPAYAAPIGTRRERGVEIDPDDFAAQVNYLGFLGKLVVPRAFAFVGQKILFTGDDPFGAEELSSLLPEGAFSYTDTDRPENESLDLVVVGQTGYSEEAIRSAMVREGEPPRFLPQEGFLDELLFGHDWWNVDVEWLNAVLEYHPGLRYVKSLETFQWPGTDAPEAYRAGVSEAEYQSETALYRLGYRITGRSRSKRWEILKTRAVPELGLQEVVETIARHCRVRKRQTGGREKYAHAIAEWEHDLGRLKREFYPGQRARFVWPRSEP